MDPNLILGSYKMDGELVGDRVVQPWTQIGTPTLGRLPDLVPALTLVPEELEENFIILLLVPRTRLKEALQACSGPTTSLSELRQEHSKFNSLHPE